MTNVEVLRRQAKFTFSEFTSALEGISEKQAWSVLPPASDEFLHTDGSIQGVVLHVAGCKMMYASIAFRGGEVRWRDLANRMEKFEPSWSASLDFLHEAQSYWLDSWSGLTDEDLEQDVPHFSGKLWPTWKILNMVTHHDSYHAGQLPVIRYATLESETPPPSSAADVRQYCRDLPNW